MCRYSAKEFREIEKQLNSKDGEKNQDDIAHLEEKKNQLHRQMLRTATENVRQQQQLAAIVTQNDDVKTLSLILKIEHF